MFQFDPSINQLPATRASIAYLAESSNQPNVAVPGRQAQSAQAFVVALRTGAQAVSVYVSLWLVLDREPAVWVHERRELPLDGIESAVADAWQFCESMGFIIDMVPSDRAPAELDRSLSRLRRGGDGADSDGPPSLVSDQPGTPGPRESAGSFAPFTPSPAQLARLGRLLASF